MDSRTALVTLARFAQGQWGMVTSAQAVTAGVSYMQLKRMAEAGLLEKAGQGVYLMIGGQAAAARHRAVKVAWLRMDPGVPAWERPLLGANSAIVSHRSAAMLLHLGDLVVRDMEFTTQRRRTSRDQMVRLRVSTLAPYEVAWADGPPVTTALRPVSDLARELLRLSNARLRSLRSLAGAAREPAIVALLSRLASDREDTALQNTGRQDAGREERPAGR